MEDAGDKEDNNQLALVEQSPIIRSLTANTTITGKLNPEAAVFNPKPAGNDGVKEKLFVYPTSMEHPDNGVKESTAQWVNKNFGGNLVTTNQSCQEIPSQTIDTNATAKIHQETDRLQLSCGKLWSDQIEELSEEGEIPDAME